MHKQARTATQNMIWAVGGGKGGIGKSFISSSLAICLAKLGKSVTLVDLDLGSANLHTCLGAKAPELTLSDFLSGRRRELRELVVQTDIPNLSIISGFNDALNVADLSEPVRKSLISGLRQIDAPVVIIDLGAGTSESTIDFFLAADQKIVAVTPEPTSIENAYRFMKSAFYRKLRVTENELGIQNLIEAAMDSRNKFGIRSPADLMKYVHQVDPAAGSLLMQRIAEFHMQIVINQVRTHQDVELGHSMKSVCNKYFGIEASYVGYIDHDNAVWQALRKKKPLLLEHPHSSLVGQFFSITKSLMNPNLLRAVV